MKKINFLLFGLLIVGSTLVSSCKKETKIENNLWKKGGEWNIERFVNTQVSTFAADNFDATILNYGTFTFKEDGGGNYSFSDDGDIEAGSFTYSNTEDKLTMIIDNKAQVFDIVEWEKDEMKITYVENFTINVANNAGTGTYTETYHLKKK